MSDTETERKAMRAQFLNGMQEGLRLVTAERDRRMAEGGALRRFLCGALEDAERRIAAEIVRLRRI